MFTTIIIFILVLSVLVFAHELGHFWTAKRFGVKPREFGFGFPPRIWGIYKDVNGKWKQVWGKQEVTDASDTVYSANWIPMGGFVNIGEDDINDIGPGSFVSKKIWQRAVILSAGVFMNVVLAAVLLSIGFMSGLPQLMGDQTDPKAIVMDRKIQITEVLPDSPADKAGLKASDVIVEVDGRKFSSIEELQQYVRDKVGKKLDYKIKRDGASIDKEITPAVIKETGEGGIGIGIAGIETVKFAWYLAIWKGVKTSILLLWLIITAFAGLIKGLFMGMGVPDSLAGPVGIAKLTGEASRMGIAYLMQFTALLSLNLAVINFVPIPALDGGRVLFLLIEKIKGKPVKREVEAVIHNIFFFLLIILIIVVTFRDVSKISFIKGLFGK
jgi:regulator of sigma E protease